MGVSIKGQGKLARELEKRLGERAFRQISDDALRAGADVFVQELKRQLETFRDEGHTIEEVTIADPETIGGVRVMRVHWKGPHGRYRVVHLNEWGTVRNPNPRGKGAIARALKNSERAYRQALKKTISEGL